MNAATLSAPTTAQRVTSDFRDYLMRHAGAIEQLSAKQRRRLRQIIRTAIR